MTARTRTTVPLGRFLSAIGDRIATMPAEELREVVLAFAESVEASERPLFLQRFGAAPARPVEATDALLADVELLEEEAESTGEPAWDEYDDYHDRYGWSPDDEFREPDWAPQLVELLRRTGIVFLNGDPSAAVHVYERIFTVVEGAAENGWSIASEPGDTDVLREAAARYLRAVGESGERGDRPERLGRAASLLGRALLADGVSYAAVEGSRVAAPAERELLLEDWVSALAPLVENDDPYRGDWAHRLLLEIVEELQGLPGLAELARGGGRRAGENFLAWFDAARRDGDDAMAAMAGQEGLRSLKRSGERAALAERTAVMAEGAGRIEDAVGARVEAWDSGPSLDRLLRVVGSARLAGVEEATITALAKSRPRAGVAAPLRVVLLVLGGRLDVALKEVREGSARSVERVVRAGDASLAAEVLIPILLAAGVDATRHDGFGGSVMARQLEAVEALVDRTQYSSFVRYRLDEDDDQNDGTRPARADVALADVVVEALTRMTVPTGTRRSYLDAGATLAADAVKRVVENKDRRRYSQVAALAVAHAEAVAIAQGQAAGDAAAEAAQSRYPRHVAYRSELMSARTSSSLLTSAARLR
jgi:hypothetical protein